MGVTACDLVVRRGRFVLNVPKFDVAATSRGTAVLGPNGAGKTTLLLALQGLIKSAGTIDRPGRTAAVFARPAVLRGSVAWNVTVVARSVRKVETDDANERTRQLLRDVGLATVANADARTLSTGERQRLALARALACDPQVLFLDEPFANVDADARPALRALVSSYCARTMCDLIVATSSLTDAVALCDRLVVLESGCVTHHGDVRGVAATEDRYLNALVAESRL